MKTAEELLNTLRSWIGLNERDGSFKKIIDVYNNHRPLPQGYKVKYSDSWCDVTVSAAAIVTGMTDLIGCECGCERHIKIFKDKGIWIEDGNIIPKVGDIILYNWDKSYQPNDGFSDHIGVVEKVDGNTITIIEGNKSDAVGRRVIQRGNGYIRGYARPKYEANTKPSNSSQKVQGISKTKLWRGVCTASALNVRTWAGTSYPKLKSIPVIYKGQEVDVCGSERASDGSIWLYICIDDKIYGFVHSDYIKRL